VACVINRQRILYNISTIIDVLKIVKEYEDIIVDFNKVVQTSITQDRLRMNRVVSKVAEAPDQEGAPDVSEVEVGLYKKIFTNLALYYQQESDKEFFYDCLKHASENTWRSIA
jgi:hypothetical protein